MQLFVHVSKFLQLFVCYCSLCNCALFVYFYDCAYIRMYVCSCVHAFVSVELFILHNHHFIYAHDLGVSASVHPFLCLYVPVIF